MDFVIANSADPDGMTHCVAFHLGLPYSIKYPIRGFWYTKSIQRLNMSYIRVQKLPSNSLMLLLWKVVTIFII